MMRVLRLIIPACIACSHDPRALSNRNTSSEPRKARVRATIREPNSLTLRGSSECTLKGDRSPLLEARIVDAIRRHLFDREEQLGVSVLLGRSPIEHRASVRDISGGALKPDEVRIVVDARTDVGEALLFRARGTYIYCVTVSQSSDIVTLSFDLSYLLQ
jgi:hypothetical protein